MKDTVFSEPISKQFEFDAKVAGVFDDMVTRSVPYYTEALEMGIETALGFLEEGDTVCDIGCSTATTLIELARRSSKTLSLIGFDNAQAMIDRAQLKLSAFDIQATLECVDITTTTIPSSKVVFLQYVLQFIRPLQRQSILREIFNALQEGGCCILAEKVLSPHPKLSKILIDNYHQYKEKNGYSRYEIMQKREALENVLIPYTLEENMMLLKECGFSHVEIIFKYNMFATFVALKG